MVIMADFQRAILTAPPMLKWLIVILIAVLVLGLVMPRLAARLPLGRLPGDVRLRWRGQEYSFPFATTLLLSLLLSLILRLL
ncbi:conserved protein of unknown function [Sterolibacterium denitrificans]|uniref:DUF2905 domain-containing protein n=3 Tax=Sterolibacterium denitrificans TaxID=157592 RepID=A0A7Z7HSS5_9PROT|nr:conserved protein of unknown function [Sterolibacterium denitrificans]